MNKGKTASQAGHAYLDSYLICLEKDPQRITEYKQAHGIKICLKAKNLAALERAQREAELSGLPNVLVHDLGYTCFEGQTTITALGVGPIRKSELPKYIQKMQMLED